MIEVQDKTDLERLEKFVATIRSASKTSHTANKIYRLVEALETVAKRFIELSASRSYTQQPRDSIELETYLTALRMPPLAEQTHQNQQDCVEDMADCWIRRGDNQAGIHTSESTHHGQHGFVHPTLRMGNQTELEHWFYENQVMVDLIGNSSCDN